MKFTGKIQQRERHNAGGEVRLFTGYCGEWTAAEREDGRLEITRDGWHCGLTVVVPWASHADKAILMDTDGYPVGRAATDFVVNLDDAIVADAVETQLRRPLAESVAAVGTMVRCATDRGIVVEQGNPCRTVRIGDGWATWEGFNVTAYFGRGPGAGNGLAPVPASKILATLG